MQLIIITQVIITIKTNASSYSLDTFFNNNLGNTDQNKQTNTDSSLNKEKGKKSIDSSCTGSISSSIEYSFPEKLSIININTQKSSANTIYAADLNSTKFDSALLNASNIRKVEESNKLLLQAQEKILQSLQILNTQGQLQKNIEINDSSNTAKISNKLNENIPQVEKKNHDQ